ncbi:hypothetical protein SAMN04488107_1456 [Geodermatophilus saharensis]|uniref:Uncharacterized protein n=1 Tax=Geodermatophilus saharensis TaxID=1137994 RepID=A0A239BV00_9ACTN|nr:hypothetical protein [Geodermatophilus saharensis]SNS11865.1 hypothetical protein SAMN04488107_1456 [Geodermatophilus saharensis]
MRRSTAVAGALAAGATILFTGPAAQAAATDVLHVPDEFVPALSDTRATGHYDVVGTGLRVWTTPNTAPAGSPGTDKVAEYVATDVPLADVGEPSLDYTATSGTIPPGFQLRIDFDSDGDLDGILIGEPASYGDDWWLNNAAAQFVKDGAPEKVSSGSGGPNHGTLDQWRDAFPNADVRAFGFSLGSGVQGDGVIESIEFAGTTYTFAEHVRLTGKQQCKDGGWASSTDPVFRNQGQCVAHFAKAAER